MNFSDSDFQRSFRQPFDPETVIDHVPLADPTDTPVQYPSSPKEKEDPYWGFYAGEIGDFLNPRIAPKENRGVRGLLRRGSKAEKFFVYQLMLVVAFLIAFGFLVAVFGVPAILYDIIVLMSEADRNIPANEYEMPGYIIAASSYSSCAFIVRIVYPRKYGYLSWQSIVYFIFFTLMPIILFNRNIAGSLVWVICVLITYPLVRGSVKNRALNQWYKFLAASSSAVKKYRNGSGLVAVGENGVSALIFPNSNSAACLDSFLDCSAVELRIPNGILMTFDGSDLRQIQKILKTSGSNRTFLK